MQCTSVENSLKSCGSPAGNSHSTSGIAGTLQVHWRYTATTLQVHCIRQCTLQIHCRFVSYDSIFVHCTYTASKWQCTCSVPAAYSAATLELYCLYTPLWSGMVIKGKKEDAFENRVPFVAIAPQGLQFWYPFFWVTGQHFDYCCFALNIQGHGVITVNFPA